MSIFFGLLFHAIGGFAAGSFYAPLKQVRGWAWESSWFVMGVGAWIVAPFVVAAATVPGLWLAIGGTDAATLAKTAALGALWGIGGLTFGLAVRYLGMGLGYAVTLGLCAVFGTLVPPLVEGRIVEVFSSLSGALVGAGLLVCVGGIALSGVAGIRRERETRSAESREGGGVDGGFSHRKGYAIAFCSGLLSACMAFAIAAGQPIAERVLALAADRPDATRIALFRNNAVLCVVLLGGFASNALWCLWLNVRRRTGADYLRAGGAQARNYLSSLAAGAIWYGQFLFYGMGTTRLGERYEFSSWTLHMAFIIVFSTLWSLLLKEWKGVSVATMRFVYGGVAVLILSTLVVGAGNFLAAR